MLSPSALPGIYEQFLILRTIARKRFAGPLGGKVLLSGGPNGLPAVVAAAIAGTASLWVEADGETLRGALRAGLCDFVVGTLDEALRILKNEVRRKRAVSVGLQADPAASLRACIDRGFQPDLLLPLPSSLQAEMRTLVERGAVVLSGRPGAKNDTSLLCWSTDLDAAKTMRHVSQIAAESLDAARADTPDRLRWLQSAPPLLGRAFANRQCLCMDRHESAKFAARVRAEHPDVRLSPENAGT